MKKIFEIDLIYNLLNYLNLKQTLNLNEICKDLNNIINEDYFKLYAMNMFSHEFWVEAGKNNPIIIIPLNSWKKEIIRINNFNNRVEKINGIIWSEDDYYKYWKFINTKNKS